MRSRTTRPWTIANLMFLVRKGSLKIPEVQRDLVWTLSQKQLLIDSLLKDYDIPKLYFRIQQEDGQKVYYVIDGQQRINAIKEFINNEFALPDDADDVNGEKVARKKWDELSVDLQMMVNNIPLDVVELTDYSDEETDETFLRLQNGTPLKAAEKRRAIQGNMREIVQKLAEHELFGEHYVGFASKHFDYEDVIAKALKQLMEGHPTTITAAALKKMYENNRFIQITDSTPTAVKRAMNFLVKAFKNNPSPQLKKYAVTDLIAIASEMLNTYNLQSYADEFGKAYLKFTDERIKNAEKPEEEQDPNMLAYSNAARGDSLAYVEYRQNYLKMYLLEELPDMELKDKSRNFSADQRAVIYRKSRGLCAICRKPISEDDFEADHIIPWSQGGKTVIANGQALCKACNLQKSDKMEV